MIQVDSEVFARRCILTRHTRVGGGGGDILRNVWLVAGVARIRLVGFLCIKSRVHRLGVNRSVGGVCPTRG